MTDSVCFLLCNPNRPSHVLDMERAADSSVCSLKLHLQSTYPGSPSPSDQRLIFEGRLLSDEELLGAVLASSRLAAHEPRKLHLAIRGQSTAPDNTKADDGRPHSTQQKQRSSTSSTPPFPSSSPPHLTGHLPAAHSPSILNPQPAHMGAIPSVFGAGGYPYAPAAYPQQSAYPPFGYPSPYSSYPAYPAATVAAMAAVSSIDPHDSFGLRQRHARSDGSTSSLAHPVATPAQIEAHAHAMAVYQQQLQQYHAMCSAMSQQMWAQQNSAGFPQAAAAGSSSLRHSPLMLSSTAATFASMSNSSAQTSGPPAGSILAALTTPQPPPQPQPQPQQQQASAQSRQQQHRQQQLLEAEEAIRAYIQSARAANAAAAAQPAAAAGAPVAAAANPAPAAVAGAAPAVPAAAAAPAAVAAPNRFGRYINVQLMAKFVVIFVLFSQGGDTQRAVLLAIASVLAYLHQVGAFRAGGPPAVVARPGAGGLLGADEDDEMEFAMAGGGGGGGGMAGGQIPPVDEPPREAAPQVAAQAPHARAPNAQAGGAEVAAGAGPGAAAAAAVAPPPVASPPPAGFVVSVEKFIVGLFASLVPSWRPVPVPLALPQPPPPVAPAAQAQAAALAPAEPHAANGEPQAMPAQ